MKYIQIMVSLILGVTIYLSMPSLSDIGNQAISAITDTGCASHIEMPDPKNLKRIDVYEDGE